MAQDVLACQSPAIATVAPRRAVSVSWVESVLLMDFTLEAPPTWNLCAAVGLVVQGS